MSQKGRTPSSSRARGLSDSGAKPLTVSQLASRIESAIQDSFPTKIRVIAEVSSVTHRTHYYFTLKDESATISAVLFASAARKLRTPPEHGQKVIASGKLEYYAPSGRLSLIVDKLEPVGQGDLEQRYKALCDDLRARGWFDPLTKQPLPAFPRSIAVITSATGAALQDVLDTAAKRCPAVRMLVVDARVQGDHAKMQVANAIRSISDHHESHSIDAVILTRGGGSLEDLWAFNEPVVATAIHDCSIPIVAAIGHETDTTIAELVADERAATPTQAAMKLVPDRNALLEQLESLDRRVKRELRSSIIQHQDKLDRLSATGPLANPERLIDCFASRITPISNRIRSAVLSCTSAKRRQLDALTLRLAKHQPAAVHARRQEHIDGLSRRSSIAIMNRLAAMSASLASAQRELNAIAPRQVLARGYSLSTTPEGSLIRSAKDLKPGDALVTHLSDGTIDSTVNGKTMKKIVARKSKQTQSPDQPSLF